MPRTDFRIEVGFTIQMDDTTEREVLATVTARINEMLAVLERKDDARILPVMKLTVKTQQTCPRCRASLAGRESTCEQCGFYFRVDIPTVDP